MTVTEFIEWLKTQDQGATVYCVKQLGEQMTPHEEILIKAAQAANASEARPYGQMERLTNQMLDASKAAKHLRSCIIRMMAVVAEHRDPQLFKNVMDCLIQDDLSRMAFDLITSLERRRHG